VPALKEDTGMTESVSNVSCLSTSISTEKNASYVPIIWSMIHLSNPVSIVLHPILSSTVLSVSHAKIIPTSTRKLKLAFLVRLEWPIIQGLSSVNAVTAITGIKINVSHVSSQITSIIELNYVHHVLMVKYTTCL